MALTKATQNVLEGIVSTGSTGVSAGSFVVAQQYKITFLGTTTQTQWNTIAGTTGQTYVVGSLFTAVTTGASSGTGAAAVARTLANRFADVINVLDFGADPTGVVDSTTFIQNAINAFNAKRASYPTTLVFPSGKYLISASLNFTLASTNQRGEVIGGNGTFEVATIICNYNGHNADPVFNLGDIAAPASQAGISISGFRFDKGASSTYQPIGIRASRIAQSRISNITVGGWNNTFLSLATPQNCRFEDLTIFTAGKSWLYKNTTGITATQSGTTVTSSAAIFSASDVGHYISIWGGSPNFSRRKMLVTAFTSTTQVTVDFSFTDAAAKQLYFDQPLVSINSASTTLTADASCFTSTDIGSFIYVKGAGQNGRLLRAKITATSGTTATLDTAASTTVSKVEFGNAAVEVYTDASASNGGSDNTFINLQVESHGGVGLVSQDNDLLAIVNGKLHSEQTIDFTTPRLSLAPIWLDQTQGSYNGGFQGQYLGKAKVYTTYQTSVFTFESLFFRTAQNENIAEIGLRATGFEGGLVQFNGLTISGGYVNVSGTSFKTIDELIIDSNTTRGYFINGKTSYDDASLTRMYAGQDGTSGWGTVLGSAITWGGTAPTSPAALNYKWQRIGYIVFYEFRLEYDVAGVLNNALEILRSSDMPNPYFGPDVDSGEYISSCNGFIATGPTDYPPALSKAWVKYDATNNMSFNVQLNTGTISAKNGCISGFYFTK